jgi:acyl-coenzyme A synthetase/AMP-(fatty) acid ligase
MAAFETLGDLIAVGADEAAAIGGFADGAGLRPPLTYAGLRRLIKKTVVALNRFGIGRGDRVAIVLPNGPEMAAAFLAVAAGATAARTSFVFI